MQTRNFDCSYKVAFAAVIDVFQDLGFIIQSSDAAIGLVIAKSSSSGSIRGIPGVSGVSSETSWETGTAHLEELGAGVSIRVSFVKNKKTSGEYGVVEERSYAITDGNFYTRFFEKIDKSIFVRKNLR
ncbi:MAG: hypothetical protein LBR91_03590 [Puniceicoccales bacterium]|nr:hypothetical protein [Puniceicoccales bacterium]